MTPAQPPDPAERDYAAIERDLRQAKRHRETASAMAWLQASYEIARLERELAVWREQR